MRFALALEGVAEAEDSWTSQYLSSLKRDLLMLWIRQLWMSMMTNMLPEDHSMFGLDFAVVALVSTAKEAEFGLVERQMLFAGHVVVSGEVDLHL